MDIWLLLYALTFLFAIPRIKWHRQCRKKSFLIDPSTSISPPTKDSYVYIRFPDDNYGSQAIMYVSSQTGYLDRSLVEFSLSAIQGYIVTYAELRLYCNYSYGLSGRTYQLRRITGGWTELGVTWNNQPAITDVNGVDYPAPTAVGWWNKAVTGIVQDALAAGTICGIRIKDSAEGTSDAHQAQFNTKEGTYDPILYVEYILPPSAPTNCSVSVLSESSLRVSWTDASTDEDDFHVERKTGAGGTYAEVQVIISTTKAGTGTVYTWDNSGLLINTTYYYRVRAHRHSDNIYSGYSNEAYATTPFYAPTNLVAISLNIDAILVQWNDNSQVESDYHLERKTSLEPTWAERTILPANSTQFTDPGLDPAIIYTYRVRAHNHAQDIYTTYSNEASEAPKLLAQIPFNPFTPLLGYY